MFDFMPGALHDFARFANRHNPFGAAIVPAICGRAWITGVSQLYVDPEDPFPEGYVPVDTWGVTGRDTQEEDRRGAP